MKGPETCPLCGRALSHVVLTASVPDPVTGEERTKRVHKRCAVREGWFRD